MRVKVTSQAQDKARRAEQEFSYLPAAMEANAEFHAEYLRDVDSYQDRTGDLRRSTVGRIAERSRDSVTVELVMDQPYATYLSRGRRDLSNFFDLVKQLSRALNKTMQGFGKRIGSR